MWTLSSFHRNGCTRLIAASDKANQLFVHGRWFSPASSTTKTGRHDIPEILLNVVLNTINNRIATWSRQQILII